MYGEAYLSQKIFTNGLNMGLPQQTRLKKTVHGVETHGLSCNEKVLGTAVSKEGDIVTVKGIITIDVLEKAENLNNAFHC